MAALRLLTQRQLQRAVLARQLLLERASLPLPRALERVAGLQSQYAPTMYVGLWSRLNGFHRDDLTRALERRQVVQGTLLRATIHLVSAADYWPTALAVRQERRQWYLRADRRNPGEAELRAAAERVRSRLSVDGCLTRKELDQVAGQQAANGVGLWLDLVRVPPSGTWERRRADLFAAAEDWLGPPPASLTTDEAVDYVVRRYLAGFGPATATEIGLFAGLPARHVLPSCERLALRRFAAEDDQVLLDLPRQPRPEADTTAPPRFLSTWEAILLAHTRRALVLREQDRPRIFHTKLPHSMNTFLVDGQVAGTWRYEHGQITLDPWRPLGRVDRQAVEEEAERLATFHR